jgi:hypothetical protein
VDGRKVSVGEDPWIGVRGNYIISKEIIVVLHSKGIFHLRDAKFHGSNNVKSQG